MLWNKIKRSAQDQSNMNLFDSKGSFFIYFFCQRLIRTYETFIVVDDDDYCDYYLKMVFLEIA